MKTGYVHGYSDRESYRLQDQANTLEELLHGDTFYSKGQRVLEAGCGVGAQTVILARNSPDAEFTCVDISVKSILMAEERARQEGIKNVRFQEADLFDLPFPSESFDAVFLCFVLEHLTDPERALLALKRLLRPGGEITIIEGDHGSAYFHPASRDADRVIECLVKDQASHGGDANIGRRLYPLMRSVGFREVRVSPRMVYVDGSKPSLVDGFTRKTFTAMVAGVRENALAAGMIEVADFDKGIADLERTACEDGTFCYTFFKGTARR